MRRFAGCAIDALLFIALPPHRDRPAPPPPGRPGRPGPGAPANTWWSHAPCPPPCSKGAGRRLRHRHDCLAGPDLGQQASGADGPSGLADRCDTGADRPPWPGVDRRPPPASSACSFIPALAGRPGLWTLLVYLCGRLGPRPTARSRSPGSARDPHRLRPPGTVRSSPRPARGAAARGWRWGRRGRRARRCGPAPRRSPNDSGGPVGGGLDLVPQVDRRRDGRVGPGPQRVGADGGLVPGVLAPVDEHLAPARGLLHVRSPPVLSGWCFFDHLGDGQRELAGVLVGVHAGPELSGT